MREFGRVPTILYNNVDCGAQYHHLRLITHYDKLCVYFCNGEKCKHFVAYQRIESGNPNIEAVFRVTVVKPVGRAKDSTNKELLPRIGEKVFTRTRSNLIP